MNRSSYYCNQTEMEQICLSAPDTDLAHSYFTANVWADENSVVLARMEDRKSSTASRLYLVDIHTGDEKFLTDRAFWGAYIVQDGFVYHLTEHDIYRTGISFDKTELIWSGGLRYRLDGPPSLTVDGRYLSVYWEMENKITSINRLDLQTGKMEEFCRIGFPYPFEKANHCMLNPHNPNQMFFSHEGTCQYITNRLWIADFESHTARNLFKQKLDAEGNNGEPCGHEMWTPDGKGIYFIKYISATVLPKGVWYYDMESGKGESVASGYEYWHVAASPCGDAAAADTQISGDTSEIAYIHPASKTEKIVALAKTDWLHPCHPHPQFSLDGKYLCYTFLGENQKTQVGIVKVK